MFPDDHATITKVTGRPRTPARPARFAGPRIHSGFYDMTEGSTIDQAARALISGGDAEQAAAHAEHHARRAVDAGDRNGARQIFFLLVQRIASNEDTAAAAHRLSQAAAAIGEPLAVADAAAGDIDAARDVFKRLSQQAARHNRVLLPAMARVLTAIAEAHRQAGRLRVAFDEVQRALLLLRPLFLAEREAYGPSMAPILRAYLSLARDSGQPVDRAMARELFAAFSIGATPQS
ncbi:hypothetical protein GCM10011505_37640 [Tistrella bauzanensis]|uniref:Tetratrico peptide repeat group 5 domain-containing protein n=2 Tax=Tistrella bauzanensis TaxID=657419 RepID=A0ABQ1IVG0_9PROT|nr:hypothetical protein GCM10011505_37640 [Tistrella bauzanensis]